MKYKGPLLVGIFLASNGRVTPPGSGVILPGNAQMLSIAIINVIRVQI